MYQKYKPSLPQLKLPIERMSWSPQVKQNEVLFFFERKQNEV